MGTKYTATAVTGYNATPPADDASQTSANQLFWSTIKTKLGDPLNVFASAIDTKLAAALDTSARKITASDSTVVGDHLRTIEIGSTVSTAITVSLGDAATMAAGYVVTINNQCAISQTIGRLTSANTINGAVANVTLPSLGAMTFKVNQGVAGYMIETDSQGNAGTTSSTFTFNGSGGATTSAITIRWRQTGIFVTLQIESNAITTTGTGSTALGANTALPASIRPAQSYACPYSGILNNSVSQATPGAISINAAGVLSIFRDASGTAFTNSTLCGFNTAAVITYCLL